MVGILAQTLHFESSRNFSTSYRIRRTWINSCLRMAIGWKLKWKELSHSYDSLQLHFSAAHIVRRAVAANRQQQHQYFGSNLENSETWLLRMLQWLLWLFWISSSGSTLAGAALPLWAEHLRSSHTWLPMSQLVSTITLSSSNHLKDCLKFSLHVAQLGQLGWTKTTLPANTFMGRVQK